MTTATAAAKTNGGSSESTYNNEVTTTTTPKPTVVTPPPSATTNEEAPTSSNEAITTKMARSRISRIIQFLLESFTVLALIAIVIYATSDEPKPTVQSSSRDNPRMITKEELAQHNGTNGTNLWLSIMGEVYDVTVAPHFYGENATYSIFVGRDANVPFVTGKFNEEEAAKPISSLSNNELWSVETFLNDTYRNSDKYPFIGILIGDLYYKDGTPTPILLDVRNRIADEKIVKAQQEKRRQDLLAERRRNDAEKAQADAERKKAEDERRRAIEEQIAAAGEMSRIELATGNSEL